MSVVEQLLDIYSLETWHDTRMPYLDALAYHDILLENGAITVAMENTMVLGYIEVWKINFEQLGRIMCGENFSAIHEDIYNGNIAFLANMWIRPEFRLGWVIKYLRLKFFGKYGDCRFYTGKTTKRSTAPFQVFRKDKLRFANEVL